MINLELNSFPSIKDKWWNEYSNIGYGTSGLYKGFRDYIEKTNPNIKTDGNIVKGITLIFEDNKLATMFVLRWS